MNLKQDARELLNKVPHELRISHVNMDWLCDLESAIESFGQRCFEAGRIAALPSDEELADMVGEKVGSMAIDVNAAKLIAFGTRLTRDFIRARITELEARNKVLSEALDKAYKEIWLPHQVRTHDLLIGRCNRLVHHHRSRPKGEAMTTKNEAIASELTDDWADSYTFDVPREALIILDKKITAALDQRDAEHAEQVKRLKECLSDFADSTHYDQAITFKARAALENTK